MVEHNELCAKWQYTQRLLACCRELAVWQMCGHDFKLPAALLVVKGQLEEHKTFYETAKDFADCFCGEPRVLRRGASWCSNNSGAGSNGKSSSSTGDGTEGSWMPQFLQVWFERKKKH
jgi:hypothetical protein